MKYAPKRVIDSEDDDYLLNENLDELEAELKKVDDEVKS
jgi:hypothetical protein